LKPVKSTDGAVLLYVQISAIVICLNPFAKALAFDRVHDLLGTVLLALGRQAKHAKSLQIGTSPNAFPPIPAILPPPSVLPPRSPRP
jgi:hypothetical protein